MTNPNPLPRFEAKICQPHQLAEQLSKLPKPIVFTNGVFDILHRGHVTYLDQAAQLGASLIVALNSDSSVKRLGKGDDRPINSLEDRMRVIASLASVSLVTYFETDTPLELIQQCHPSVLVKGGDWPVQQIVGYAEVIGWGGQVVSIPFDFQRSTTSTLNKIRGV